jgi:hypothetical protein
MWMRTWYMRIAGILTTPEEPEPPYEQLGGSRVKLYKILKPGEAEKRRERI